MIELGLCVPISCSTTELHSLLQQYIDRYYLYYQKFYHLDIQIEELKQLKQSDSFMNLPKSVITISICLITFFLIVVGTIYDVNFTQPTLEDKKLAVEAKKDVKAVPNRAIVHQIGNVMQCFSIYSNVKALIKTDITPNSIGALHGVRLFSFLWVMCVHGVFFQIDYLDNVPTGFRISEPFLVQILSNSTYCVDSFLFLRLTPVYAMTILMSDMLFTHYRQTSALYASEQPDINCPRYWWRNLLYINNLFPRSEMCMSWSWYLSADTQFFLIASILLILSTVLVKHISL